MTHTTTAEHSPEPWIIEEDSFGDEYTNGFLPTGIYSGEIDPVPVITSGDDCYGMFCCEDQPDGNVAWANANRIVAAINECVGISTAELEAGIITDLVNAVRSLLAAPTSDAPRAFALTVLARIGEREPRRMPAKPSQ